MLTLKQAAFWLITLAGVGKCRRFPQRGDMHYMISLVPLQGVHSAGTFMSSGIYICCVYITSPCAREVTLAGKAPPNRFPGGDSPGRSSILLPPWS